MGHGIAYLLAAAGHKVAYVRTVGRNARDAAAAIAGDRSICSTTIRRPDGTNRAHEALAPAMQGAAFVFEAAPEKLPLKQQIFAELERHVAPDTILASNSSAIPSTEIGRHLAHRERVLGTHFWNPPHLVPLVEVIQNEKTSDDVVRADHGAVARRRKNAGPCAARYSGLRRQPAAARDEARGDRAGRRRRLRRRDDRYRGQRRLRRAHGRARADGADPISSASISPSTSPRCFMRTSIARRARIRFCATRSRPASSA